MKPESEAELAEMVAAAKGPLRIVGGGTRDIGAPVDGDVLSAAGLSGITLYEPGALTLVARAGTPLEEIEAALAAEGQRLGFEPMDHRVLLGTQGTPTIGGVVAANVSGPRRIQAGACRDSALGVRFIDGTGQILKNGGRVMKNVTGYDLVKLMAGSWGTLGVLSEVSLKVQAIPECVGTLAWRGLGWIAAQKVFADALGSPFDVTGAARLPEGWGSPDEKSWTFVRVEGLEESVNYRLGRLQELVSVEPEKIVVDSDENAKLWQAVRDVEPFAGKPGNVWRWSVKPSDMIKVTGKWDFQHVVDWGGGLVWSLVPEDIDFRLKLEGLGGHATLVRASDTVRADVPVFHPESSPVAALSKGLRARFDPRGILNPGLMG
ncbi:FAD-binding protein [Shimia sp. W99]